jgi:predicted N-acetyltransferase YhbS
MTPAPAIVVRTGTAADVEDILDLLAHYEQPRSAFEPWYRADPTYRPEQSWLVEENGELVAHLRMYRRTLRMSGTQVSVAGVGNVITAPQARRRGHADRLLRAAISAASADGIAYSLLWTHLPRLYARHGYGSIPEQAVEATAEPVAMSGARRASDADLPRIAAAEERFDASRSGPALRDLDYWAGSRRWLGDDILVADTATGVAGYVRYLANTNSTEILELGVDPGDECLGRGLLGTASADTDHRFRAVLPPSLLPVVEPWSHEVLPLTGLMARPLSLDALANVLQPVWSARLAASRRVRASVSIQVAGEMASLDITAQAVTVGAPEVAAPTPLDSTQLSSLLFRGCDPVTRQLLGSEADIDLLSTISPPQDFVIWPADAF